MKASPEQPASSSPASDQIDAIVRGTPGWHGETLARLRASIRKADPDVVEEIKWRKPSSPDGVPVWSHDGILCVGNVLKASVRLTFPKGRQIKDPKHLFNSRLDSATVRALDVHQGEVVAEAALKAIIVQAIELNLAAGKRR